MSEPILFKECTAEQLSERLGIEPRVARKLQAAVVQRGRGHVPFDMPEVSPRLLDRVRAATAIPRLRLLDRVTSPYDGFTKYLFQGDGPDPFEAVRIPLLHRPDDRKY